MKLENGYYMFEKGAPDLLSYHFKAAEFECHCKLKECGTQLIAKELIDKLETIRLAYGKSITVTSGYRCQAHQDELRAQGFDTAKTRSQHEFGRAADISAANIPSVLKEAEREFKAIGIARTWLHVDLRADKVRRWRYV